MLIHSLNGVILCYRRLCEWVMTSYIKLQRGQDVELSKKQSEFIFFDSCGLKCVLYRINLFIVVLSLLFGVEKCFYADYELEF